MLPTFTIQHIQQRSSPSSTSSIPFCIGTQAAHEGIQLSQATRHILQPSFVCVIIGNPGAGKTTVLEEILSNQSFYGKKFERVLFIGPTKYTNLIQDGFNWKFNLQINWIYEKIEQANNWSCRSMLIVLDDVVASLKSCQQIPLFVELFYNRRHLLHSGVISFIITTQKWNLLPTFIRGIINQSVIFSLSPQQIDIVSKEICVDLPRKALQSIITSLKKHEFIFINSSSRKVFNNKWVQL